MLREPAGGVARRGILAIGNLLVDKMHRIGAYPAESMLEVITESSMSPGGGVLNVLFDLAVVDPTLPLAAAGLVGRDEDGAYLQSECERRHIDARRIAVLDDAPTSFTHVMISRSNATRTFFHAHGANARLGLDQFRAIESSARIAHVAYLLILQGLDVAGGPCGSRGAEALKILRDKGFVTSLDLISDPDPTRYGEIVRPALAHTDYLIVNDVEAANLTGLAKVTAGAEVDWDLARRQAATLIDMGVSSVVAIHFPEGAVAMSRSGDSVALPSYRVPKAEVVSALGAGDAFCAGLLYGLHESCALETCVKLGAALAHFNLFAASATDGAVSRDRLFSYIAERDRSGT
ncbi:carbohydrate kinase family protein [Oryzibacter oryziterrae]|uniref:carbohydrate kinase family protein n=1 Tax=Oryzibacter oryziterrae TaxID=2766474 RepID=UPI001F35ACCB|nr:carbohydrate kinase family protein [Oryzibacter oryziterrae]